MRTVKLLSWHPDLPAKTSSLAASDLKIDPTPLIRISSVVTELARLNPAAVVLDLDKLPSNSREIALMLRASKSARHIPILLAGTLPAEDSGHLPNKYARLKSELPDLPYAAWPEAPKALRSLLDHPATTPPVIPPPRTYTNSLPQKLGILSASAKAQATPKIVALIAAPEGFIASLGDLPNTVTLSTRLGTKTNLAICFIRSLEELPLTLDLLVYNLPAAASAWIAYPKRTANPSLGFNENDVRDAGLKLGLVDYKICSIDAQWSAMKFARRKP